ncbi:MAG: PQQ-binding-like beta-propeller repeat protein [Lentisphaerae bacterium]|jgi:outer membrane protein assembly factor BamB|nr:PQQ-binding-like beta-propeller repeat protein [Lentisphaerota bacterium]MBT5612488.1 PQQ-binding-like beta-propeller repeat protein [Lentisphaerota bacterium]MBT7061915.1 PQQ-binding-like beta-propeller repeat protein [Lentisphaerota bacterium]MBT7845983.1 PQQ-binding-like beta-propeller repeat protein [Lentisphaerota bacterium]
MNKNPVVLFCAIMVVSPAYAVNPADAIANSGIRGGIIVHLNCGDGRETAGMVSGDRFLVHGLDRTAENIAKARGHLRSKDLYGRASVTGFGGKTLPYGDNVVNLIITDNLGDVPEKEAMRVLVPGGILTVGDTKTVKPWPKDIDDWPQYLNKADNNAVAMDSVVGPPRRIQWVDNPVWARSHMAISTLVSAVSGNGRLFTIEDTAPTENPFLPAAFKIVARDAFNGRTLWRHTITQWDSITMYIKCLPVQQQRRMAVVGDTLYCTFELEGAVSAVDAATGEVLKVYEDTSPAQEVAFDQGVLFVNVGNRFRSAAYNIVKTKGRPFVKGVDPSEPFHGAGFRRGYAPEITDKDNPVSVIMAVNPKTGQRLWQTKPLNNYTAASLAVKRERAVYQTAEGLFCVSARTGKELWANRKDIVNALGHDSKTPGTTPNTVVITDDKVFAVESKPVGKKVPSVAKSTVYAYSLKDGRQLWQAPAAGNYEASSDVFYIDGSLWVGGGGTPVQHDATTGKVIKTIKQGMKGPMSHDRCYRNMITKKYFINSKTGGADFLDLQSGVEMPHHWTRGGCGLGVLPANGLLYSTPYSCSCSLGSMFQGMNAYASIPGLAKSDAPVPVVRSVRLDKGPAYGEAGYGKPAGTGDWPTYRCNGARSGIAGSAMDASLTKRWTVTLPSRPSAVTSAGGRLFVCGVDAHTLYALNCIDGGKEWSFTTDGRIDSPPTYHRGMVFFGSRDGWLYCLRAGDGKLVYRFRDLPNRLICAYGQLESAWPVSGSVLVLNDRLHFSAGRSSYLDGGIVLYSLDPATGKLLNSRVIYGPFDSKTGFPVANKKAPGLGGFKNGIMVTDGANIYLRHKSFTSDLADLTKPQKHIIPLGGFLDRRPQHRTGWILSTSFNWWQKARDIMVTDGKAMYEVEGFPIFHNHSYFDPRRSGYKLIASEPAPSPSPAAVGRKGKARKGKASRKRGPTRRETWRTNIPITGKALALAGDVLFVAGEPMTFPGSSYKTYVDAYAGKLGGRLLAVSATEGKQLAEYALDAAPAWDAIAIANGQLFVCLENGTVQCFGREP